MKFTVFGGGGFIGRHLVAHLLGEGHQVQMPPRDLGEFDRNDLGHAIYAIGLTGDFRERTQDAIEAHVGLLSRLLSECRFESWLYLSSTRIYAGCDVGEAVNEDAPVRVLPGADAIYDLSKLLGESLCMAAGFGRARVARLSNVIGPGQGAHDFLGSVLAEMKAGRPVRIREHPESGKDYIAVRDAVSLLARIAISGKHCTYNVASGRTVSHAELSQMITRLTRIQVHCDEHGAIRRFPDIDVSRAQQEFGFRAQPLEDSLRQLLDAGQSDRVAGAIL